MNSKYFWYDDKRHYTTDVINVLDNLYETKKRVRFFYGNQDTGVDWLEQYDIMGRVGRSTGTNKIPLLINNARCRGGSAILADRILRIIDIATRRELYRHPLYKQPDITIVYNHNSPFPQLHYEAVYNGETYAHFTTIEAAHSWRMFMEGLRFTWKP